MIISDFGRQISKTGGWLKHLDKLNKEILRLAEKEQLEIDLTRSNIEANKLNQANSKFNKRATTINITIAVLNILTIIAFGLLTYKAGLLK